MKIRSLAALALILSLMGCSGSRDVQGGTMTPPADPEPAIDFYAEPPLGVQQFVLAEGEEGAPREIRFFVPDADGEYPLLQFQHGFISDVDTYTDMLARLAGFGFIIAGPQMYVGDPSTAPSVPDETAAAVSVLAWVQDNVDAQLSTRLSPARAVTADTSATGLFGHSRGGQVAWRMLFDHPETDARAIAGVDPVDGDAPPFPPGETGELVTDDPGAFQFPFASLIIGMGLGNTGAPGFECAPEARNYTLFYDASQPPRYEVVATGHGHSDMLNGDEPDAVCPGATDGSRPQLRVFCAGQLAAYFGSVLRDGDHFEWLRDLSSAPVPTAGRFEEL